VCVSCLHDCPCHCWCVGVTVQLHCGLTPASSENTRAWCSLAAYLLRSAVRKSQKWTRKEFQSQSSRPLRVIISADAGGGTYLLYRHAVVRIQPLLVPPVPVPQWPPQLHHQDARPWSTDSTMVYRVWSTM
jgi:hypothetical protein